MIPVTTAPAYIIPLPPRPARDAAPPQPTEIPYSALGGPDFLDPDDPDQQVLGHLCRFEPCDYLEYPCPFLPASWEKLEVMAARFQARLPLHIEGDAGLGERDCYLPAHGPTLNADTNASPAVAAIAVELPGGGLRIVGASSSSQRQARRPLSHAKPRQRAA